MSVVCVGEMTGFCAIETHKKLVFFDRGDNVRCIN